MYFAARFQGSETWLDPYGREQGWVCGLTAKQVENLRHRFLPGGVEDYVDNVLVSTEVVTLEVFVLGLTPFGLYTE